MYKNQTNQIHEKKRIKEKLNPYTENYKVEL